MIWSTRTRTRNIQETRHRWYQESKAFTRRKEVTHVRVCKCLFAQWKNKSDCFWCFFLLFIFFASWYLNWNVLHIVYKVHTTHYTPHRNRDMMEFRLSSAYMNFLLRILLYKNKNIMIIHQRSVYMYVWYVWYVWMKLTRARKRVRLRSAIYLYCLFGEPSIATKENN